MKGKSFWAAMAGLSAGLAAGLLLGQHIGIDLCTDDEEENACRKRGAEKPPLHVKPVPIVKKTSPEPEGSGADDTPQEDTE